MIEKQIYKQFVRTNPFVSTACAIPKADTYNPAKTKYWVEERVSASTEQKARLEMTDKTTIKADPRVGEDGGIIMGHGLGFDFSEIGAGDSSGGPSITTGGFFFADEFYFL